MGRRLQFIVAQKVAKLLRERPNEWRHERLSASKPYIIEHRCGVAVWVANGGWGLDVRFDDEIFGGVTMWAVFGGSPAQHIVWHEAKRWLRDHPLQTASSPLHALNDALSAALSPADQSINQRSA